MSKNKNVKPIISIIVAMANNRVIGKDNDMPWDRLPIDLKHFKEITNGSPIIMGRKTFESIGKPLPNRTNIIITRNKDLKIENCEIVSSLEKAIELIKEEDEVFIIGGSEIYKEAINKANKLYITLIDLEIEGDTYFPEYKNLKLKTIDNEIYFKNKINKYTVEFIEYLVEKSI